MKLPGRYKGTRKRHAPPQIIIIECPGCGWRSQPGKSEEADIEYVLHLSNVHHGTLECAFCPKNVRGGLRYLPDFQTLAAHVRHYHPERFKGVDDPEALPPHAFK